MRKQHNNPDFDGRMTLAHKERLDLWQTQQIDEMWDKAWENDPAFRASMEAMQRVDEIELDEDIDFTGFEYLLAGDVAGWAADDFSEAEWFEGLTSNRVMLFNFEDSHIPFSTHAPELVAAITLLKSFELWPWP
ncbi:MAG: hypothetical protein J0I20_29410 [Chloroflexi bacterium]|nr:hypothetical protein [Chloroflexota bacterium]OJV95045.1 MAG: hypothetical protein BGO39_28705 [Chloroflexi bacterium 54-19]